MGWGHRRLCEISEFLTEPVKKLCENWVPSSGNCDRPFHWNAGSLTPLRVAGDPACPCPLSCREWADHPLARTSPQTPVLMSPFSAHCFCCLPCAESSGSSDLVILPYRDCAPLHFQGEAAQGPLRPGCSRRAGSCGSHHREQHASPLMDILSYTG